VIAWAAECSVTSLRRVLANTPQSRTSTDPTSPKFWAYWRRDGGLPALCRALDRALSLAAVSAGPAAFCTP
jgi:hypothetical protein